MIWPLSQNYSNLPAFMMGEISDMDTRLEETERKLKEALAMLETASDSIAVLSIALNEKDEIIGRLERQIKLLEEKV